MEMQQLYQNINDDTTATKFLSLDIFPWLVYYSKWKFITHPIFSKFHSAPKAWLNKNRMSVTIYVSWPLRKQ